MPDDMAAAISSELKSLSESDPGLYIIYQPGLMHVQHAGNEDLNLTELAAKETFIQMAVQQAEMELRHQTSAGAFFKGTLAQFSLATGYWISIPWARHLDNVPDVAEAYCVTNGGTTEAQRGRTRRCSDCFPARCRDKIMSFDLRCI